jgi:hypothetical protein
MAVPTTGIRMEKMIVGMPNTEAAAGEVKADPILNIIPPLFVSRLSEERSIVYCPLPADQGSLHIMDAGFRQHFKTGASKMAGKLGCLKA